MKKLFALVLALALMVVPAMAAGGTADGTLGDNNIGNVVVSVEAENTPDVYSILIEWDDMTSFKYKKGTKTWNEDTFSYDVTGAGFDGGNTANITVTNKSNVKLSITATATELSDTDGFKATLANSSYFLESYAELSAGNPDVKTTVMTVELDTAEVSPSTGGSVAQIVLRIEKI